MYFGIKIQLHQLHMRNRNLHQMDKSSCRDFLQFQWVFRLFEDSQETSIDQHFGDFLPYLTSHKKKTTINKKRTVAEQKNYLKHPKTT